MSDVGDHQVFGKVQSNKVNDRTGREKKKDTCRRRIGYITPFRSRRKRSNRQEGMERRCDEDEKNCAIIGHSDEYDENYHDVKEYFDNLSDDDYFDNWSDDD